MRNLALIERQKRPSSDGSMVQPFYRSRIEKGFREIKDVKGNVLERIAVDVPFIEKVESSDALHEETIDVYSIENLNKEGVQTAVPPVDFIGMSLERKSAVAEYANSIDVDSLVDSKPSPSDNVINFNE